MKIEAWKSRNHGHPGSPGAPKREVNRRRWSSEAWWTAALRKRGHGGGKKEGCGCLNLAKYKGGPSESRTPASATKPPKRVFRDHLLDAPVNTFTTKRHRRTTLEKIRFRDQIREPKYTQKDACKISFVFVWTLPKTCFSEFRSLWAQKRVFSIGKRIDFKRFVEFAKPL